MGGFLAVFHLPVGTPRFAGAVLARAVTSVSGTVLAVCSRTVLPLFGGICKRGAGLLRPVLT